MNKLMKFENQEVEIIIDENGQPLFELYSTGMALGQVKVAKYKEYPRKDRIDENITNADIKPVVHNGQQYLTEEMLYDLMLEMKTEKVKPFRKWITHDVLPSIRKTGRYDVESNQSNVTVEQGISLADIISKTPEFSLPHVVEIIKVFLPKYNPDIKPKVDDPVEVKSEVKQIKAPVIRKNNIVKHLKSIMTKYKLNQTQLAELFGIPKSTLSTWLHGSASPTDAYVIKLKTTIIEIVSNGV